MSAITAEQLNKNYIRLPKSDKLAGLSFGKQQVIGEIFSFTGTSADGKPMDPPRSYDKFVERCDVSRATVSRAIHDGRSMGLITGNRKEGFTCTIEAENGVFWRLPQWVCKEEFKVRENVTRKLTFSERKLYAFIYTYCTAKRNGKHRIKISISKLAKETGLSERTVQRALWTLIRAGLIFRAKEDKGVNAYKVSEYALNYKLVLIKEKTDKQIRKEAEKQLARASEEASQEPPPSPSEIGDEFVQHTKPRRERGSRSGNSNRKPQRVIEIPERTLYQKGDLEYDFSSASDAELQSLLRLYIPQFEFLSNTGQAFIKLVKYELQDRTERNKR